MKEMKTQKDSKNVGQCAVLCTRLQCSNGELNVLGPPIHNHH